MATARTDMGPYAMVPLWLILKVPDATAIQLFALIAAKYADHDTNLADDFTRADLAELTGKSVDTVDRACRKLQAAGALKVQKRFSQGSQISNLYHLFYADPSAPNREEILDEINADDLSIQRGRKFAAPPPHGCGPVGRKSGTPIASFQKESSNEDSPTAVSAEDDRPGMVDGDSLRNLFAQLLIADGEPANLAFGNVNSPRSVDAACAMFAEDGRELEEAKTLLRWSQHDPTWRRKITTIAGFRQLYRHVKIAAEEDTRNGRAFPAEAAIPAGTVLVDQADVDAIREVFRCDVSEDVDGIWIEELWFGWAEIDGVRTLVGGGPSRAVSWIELRYRRVLADCASRALGVSVQLALVVAPDPPKPTREEAADAA